MCAPTAQCFALLMLLLLFAASVRKERRSGEKSREPRGWPGNRGYAELVVCRCREFRVHVQSPEPGWPRRARPAGVEQAAQPLADRQVLIEAGREELSDAAADVLVCRQVTGQYDSPSTVLASDAVS